MAGQGLEQTRLPERKGHARDALTKKPPDMPAPRTETHEPKKVYFSASEVMRLLECPERWLYVWTVALGFKTRNKGHHHRYSVSEINELTRIRQTVGIGRPKKPKIYELYSDAKAGQLPAEPHGQNGNGHLETQANPIPEGENRPEFRGVDNGGQAGDKHH